MENKIFKNLFLLTYIPMYEQLSNDDNRTKMLDYWSNDNKFTELIRLLFGEREFFTGEYFDLMSVRTLELGFERDINKDFADIFIIKRKCYSIPANNYPPVIYYELGLVNL